MDFNSKFWLRISLVNLLLVALLGLLMRYKIGFEFPYFNQKNLQHSHSHFAFSGWVSHALMTLMIIFLKNQDLTKNNINKYNKILFLNLISAYGMLVFFIIQGYGAFSIFFSTMSIFVSYIFSYYFIKDLKFVSNQKPSKDWFRAALFFNIISSLGPFVLAYMMISKNFNQTEYLASIYYYLHFQYNGWFFFACMGLFFFFTNIKYSEHSFYKKTFLIMFFACLQGYFMSILWINLPVWIYVLTWIAALLQVYSWFGFLIIIVREKINLFKNFSLFLRYILVFIVLAVSIKLLLQLGSNIPKLGNLAFGFRPIVIAYLHLVLLAIISLFLLFYIYANGLIGSNNKIKKGIIIFSFGILLNEIILAAQGIASFSYTVIPYINQSLFVASIVLATGIGIIIVGSLKKI